MGENPTPVAEDGQLLGLITRSDVIDVPQGYWDERTVQEIMQPMQDIKMVTPLTPLAHILPWLVDAPINPLPLVVAENGQLLGLIDLRDVEPLLDVHDVLGMSYDDPANDVPVAQPKRQVLRDKQQGAAS